MVRTVNIRVTIQTRISHDLIVICIDRAPIIGTGRMVRANVAALAEEREPRDKHLFIVGTMWIMAIHTVFAHWRMLKYEGTALIRMTGVAGLVSGS